MKTDKNSEGNGLKVLFLASEATPYAKSGGLGDVAGSLPAELRKLGVDVRIVLPKYKLINEDTLKNLTFIDSFTVTLEWRRQSASIYKVDADVPTYLIENDYYFGRDGFYGFWDDDERFAFFTKAAIELTNCIDFRADIFHLNDWQAGLGAVYLKDIYAGFTMFHGVKTVFTIHNIQYQGNFGKHALARADLNEGYFSPDKLEFYGRMSFMKAGIVYSDAVTTVSETYCREIQSFQYGYGMDALLRANSHKLYGILNGIDVSLNDPATDTRIFANYDTVNLDGKKENKRALQALLSLPQTDAPLISIISRLVDQKGLDLVAVALEELMHIGVQVVVLGTGDGRYEHLFWDAARRYPDRLSANIYFSNDLAQRIYAGSDIFLMPSLFEPCGLGQLFSMRYGAVPVVRNTGGLSDTVRNFNPKDGTGNGFVFNDYLASGMMWAVNEALRTYWNEPDNWRMVVRNAMSCDFSWERSARKYVELYTKLKG